LPISSAQKGLITYMSPSIFGRNKSMHCYENSLITLSFFCVFLESKEVFHTSVCVVL